MQVLLLEDDLELGVALQRALERCGLPTRWVRLISAAQDALTEEPHLLAVLDIGVPDGSGLDLLTWIRDRRLSLPVIMLTARGDVSDRVLALDNGADDYLAKPFALEEFLSRARALIRRGAGFASRTIKLHDIVVDIDAHRVWQGDSEVDLAPTEFALLTELVGRLGRVLTRPYLEHALHMEKATESNAIEVHIHHLRRKLGSDLIRTVRGVGYIIDRQAIP